jgi:hypothetical protein
MTHLTDVDLDEIAADAALSTATPETLHELVSALDAAVMAVEIVEGELAAKKAQLKQLVEVDIPDALLAAGVAKFETADGRVLAVDDVVVASIKKDNREAAHAWLEEHGHGGLIKREATIVIPRGDDAAQLTADLRELVGALELEMAVDETVHAQTLGAWVREYLEAQRNAKTDAQWAALPPLPKDLLGIFEGRKASLKATKAKKAKKATA